MRRGADGALLARSVVHAPTGHKHVPDGITIDAGEWGLVLWRRGRALLLLLLLLLPTQPSRSHP